MRLRPILTAAGVKRGFVLLEKWTVVPKDMGRPSDDSEMIGGVVAAFPSVTDEAFYAACLKLSRSREFFPRLGNFETALFGSVETRGEVAWDAVREAIRSFGQNGTLFASDLGGDRAATWVVSRMGWVELCATPGGEMNFRRAEFLRLYAVAVEAGKEEGRVAGAAELGNQGNGTLRETPERLGRSSSRAIPEIGHEALPMRAEEPLSLPERSGGEEGGEIDEETRRRVHTMIYGSPEVAERYIAETNEMRDTSIAAHERREEAEASRKRGAGVVRLADKMRMPE